MVIKNDIEKLYVDKCDIYYTDEVFDDISKITKHKKILKYQDIKCRISYKNGSRKLLSAEETDKESKTSQSAKLFIGNEYDIKAGSEFIIRHNGQEIKFKFGGIASVYEFHQEIVILRAVKEA